MTYYEVKRYGERTTTKRFTNLADATAYYDKQCRNMGRTGYRVILQDDRFGIIYHTVPPITGGTGITYASGEYRNVAKKKKDKEWHPFGL